MAGHDEYPTTEYSLQICWSASGMTDSDECLERLGELLDGMLLPDRETASLRALASLHLLASTDGQASLMPADRALVSIVIARWVQAWDDNEQAFHLPWDEFHADRPGLAKVLNVDRSSIDLGLDRLAAADVVTIRSADSLDLSGLLRSVSASLVPLLYRDFYDRHGKELIALGSFFLTSLGEDLDEMLEEHHGSARTRELVMKLQRLRASTSSETMSTRWFDRPQVVYDWLGELAILEDQIAVARGLPRYTLADSLARRQSQRLVVLSGRLRPPVDPGSPQAVGVA